MILVDVGGSMLVYIEAHGSFYGTGSWKLQSIEANGRTGSGKLQSMEANGSFHLIDSGKFQVYTWKLPLTSTEVHLLPPTSIYASMEVNLASIEVMSTSVGVDFGGELTSMEVDRTEAGGPLWKSSQSNLEVGDTRRRMWK